MAYSKKQKRLFIENLEKVPLVQVACEKSGIARATYYRWLKKDPDFAEKAQVAQEQGVLHINDLAESKLISRIQDGNMTAISYWLNNHHPSYRVNKFKTDEGTSEPDLKQVVRKVNDRKRDKEKTLRELMEELEAEDDEKLSQNP